VTLSRDKHSVDLVCETCFYNVINFHGTGVNVILFTPKQTQGFHWLFCLKFPNSEHKCVNIAYTNFNLNLAISNEITDNFTDAHT
jgi:hypothetical protein